MLKQLEDFAPKAYKDGEANGKQLYSIGYGHQIRPSEYGLMTATITQQKAVDFMTADLSPIEAQISSSKRSFNQNQFDALCSFGYNYPLGLTKILSLWNTGASIADVQTAMKQYKFTTKNGNKVVSADLVARREKETALFAKASLPVLPIAAGAILLGALLLFR
jgi:lysozyme